MSVKLSIFIFVCTVIASTVCETAAPSPPSKPPPTSMKDAFDMEMSKLKAMLPPVSDPLGLNNLVAAATKVNQTYCTCAVFLNGQFTKGSKKAPSGNPALLHEQENMMSCNTIGTKQCTNKCLETVRVTVYVRFSLEIFRRNSILLIYWHFRLQNICQIRRQFCAAASIVMFSKNVPISSFRIAMANGLTQICRRVVNFVAKTVHHTNVHYECRNPRWCDIVETGINISFLDWRWKSLFFLF